MPPQIPAAYAPYFRGGRENRRKTWRSNTRRLHSHPNDLAYTWNIPNHLQWEGMAEQIENGSLREIDGRTYIRMDGYWIRHYAPPVDSMEAKKKLIHALTRRLFNHVEHGINIPGRRLDEARAAYEAERDMDLKRVKGGMLAGALFNRAADIFTRLVELQQLGVQIESNNSLMRECGRCLMEALEFGKSVRHRSGEESIDELWGEPFKAFSIPVEDFYLSRYIKIAQTMREIDRIAGCLAETLGHCPLFPAALELIRGFAEAAKRKCETLRTDRDIFDIWPNFVVAGERLCCLEPQFSASPSKAIYRLVRDGQYLIQEGRTLIDHVARARVPMPTSTHGFLERCDGYKQSLAEYYGGVDSSL